MSLLLPLLKVEFTWKVSQVISPLKGLIVQGDVMVVEESILRQGDNLSCMNL